MKNKLESFTQDTLLASELFNLDLNEVEPKHREAAKAHRFALGYGHRGHPLRTYTVDESGVVSFDYESQEEILAAAESGIFTGI